MSRLTHSFPALRRSMQMSRNTFFIFVEGKSDKYFYSKICESVFRAEISYEIYSANQLGAESGGKSILIQLFKYLRNKASLYDKFEGKRTISHFYLDKDIDDILRIRLRSIHLTYTEYYAFENYLFIEGDLAESAAAAASIDVAQLKILLNDYNNWRQKAASIWKIWLVLCVLAKVLGLGVCNYSVSSQVNEPLIGSVNTFKCNHYLNLMKSRTTLTDEQFEILHSKIENKVNSYFKAGEHDKIFRGIWYGIFMENEIKSLVGNNNYESKDFLNRLRVCLTLNLDYNQKWSIGLRNPLIRLIELI